MTRRTSDIARWCHEDIVGANVYVKPLTGVFWYKQQTALNVPTRLCVRACVPVRMSVRDTVWLSLAVLGLGNAHCTVLTMLEGAACIVKLNEACH